VHSRQRFLVGAPALMCPKNTHCAAGMLPAVEIGLRTPRRGVPTQKDFVALVGTHGLMRPCSYHLPGCQARGRPRPQKQPLRLTLLRHPISQLQNYPARKKPLTRSTHLKGTAPKLAARQSAQRRATVPVAEDPQPRALRAIAQQQLHGHTDGAPRGYVPTPKNLLCW